MSRWQLRGLMMSMAITILALVPLRVESRGEGPVSLFLIYDCQPETRTAFRAHMAGAGVNQFEQWKKEGVFKDYLILFSSYVNEAGWDMLIRLDFDAYAGIDRWRAIERQAASGLRSETLSLCSPTRSYLMDPSWEKAAPSRDLAKAVYVVAPYSWWELPHKTQNKRAIFSMWFEAKPKKEYDAWVDEGGLSWYGAYLNQWAYGKAWAVLVLLEYRGPAALARRELTKQLIRKQKLASIDPAWGYVRSSGSAASGEVVLADPILPR